MQAFAALYAELDKTTRTSGKLKALADYLRQAPAEDAAWAVHFLIGRRPRRAVPARKLAGWAGEVAGVPEWLFEACYYIVGDLAETIALLLPPSTNGTRIPLHIWVEAHLLPLAILDEPAQKEAMLSAWRQMNATQRLLWNKLITGEFRIGVSQRLLTRALAQVSGVESALIAHRLMGAWTPSADFYKALISQADDKSGHSRPYPFSLAYPLDQPVEKLGDRRDWLAEWKWDGIRAQLIRRSGEAFIWSRGEGMVNTVFPELVEAARRLPEGCIVDGEILAFHNEAPMGFAVLQRRLGRKRVDARTMTSAPVALMAFDLIAYEGHDWRGQPLAARRQQLETIVAALSDAPRIRLSPEVTDPDWPALARRMQESRNRGVEGLMLKRRSSTYQVGRKRGDWWKWKVDPYRIDAVLIYAHPGHGRRSGLFTDYTFAVWQGDELVPVAKAYSGLTDAEIREVDRFIRTHTVERYGPVRAVKPELVFELAFEGIQHSTRHKSGLAVRFPRIARRRPDKLAREADTLETLQALLPGASTKNPSREDEIFR